MPQIDSDYDPFYVGLPKRERLEYDPFYNERGAHLSPGIVSQQDIGRLRETISKIPSWFVQDLRAAGEQLQGNFETIFGVLRLAGLKQLQAARDMDPFEEADPEIEKQIAELSFQTVRGLFPETAESVLPPRVGLPRQLDDMFNDLDAAHIREDNILFNAFGPNANYFEPVSDFNPDLMWDALNDQREKAGRGRFPDSYFQHFENSQSPLEFFDKYAKLQQEMLDEQQIVNQGFWTNLWSGLKSGVVSPFTVLPVGGGVASGLRVGGLQAARAVGKSAGISAGWSLPALAIEESLLFNAQETRTLGESLVNVAAGSVLNGLLGGVVASAPATVKYMRDKRLFDKTWGELQEELGWIPTGTGADVAENAAIQSDPKFKRGILKGTGVEEALMHMAPNMRLANNNYSGALAEFARRISVSGIPMEQGGRPFAPAPGGDAETLGNLLLGNYHLTVKVPAFALMRQYRKRVGNRFLHETDFNRKTFHAMQDLLEQGKSEAEPEIQAAAKLHEDFFRNNFREVTAEAERRGTPYKPYEGVTEEDFIRSFTRILDKKKVEQNRDKFEGLLLHFAKKDLELKIEEQVKKRTEAIEAKEAEAELIGTPVDKGEELYRSLESKLNILAHDMGVDQIVADIETARHKARTLRKQDPDQAKQFDQMARDFEEVYAEKLKPYKEERRKIRAGMRLVERSAFGIIGEIEKTEADIARVEDGLVRSLQVFERNTHKFLNSQEAVSPEAAKARIAELESEFEKINAMMAAEHDRLKPQYGDQPVPLEVQRHVESRLRRAGKLEQAIEEIEDGKFTDRHAQLEKKLQKARDTIKRISLAKGKRRAELAEVRAGLDPRQATNEKIALARSAQKELDLLDEWFQGEDINPPVRKYDEQIFETREEAEQALADNPGGRVTFFVERAGTKYDVEDEGLPQIRATHNIGAEDLERVFETGGMLAPSIAIQPSDIPNLFHADRGDTLSLVLKPEVLQDPDLMVFLRDAYSPTPQSLEELPGALKDLRSLKFGNKEALMDNTTTGMGNVTFEGLTDALVIGNFQGLSPEALAKIIKHVARRGEQISDEERNRLIYKAGDAADALNKKLEDLGVLPLILNDSSLPRRREAARKVGRAYVENFRFGMSGAAMRKALEEDLNVELDQSVEKLFDDLFHTYEELSVWKNAQSPEAFLEGKLARDTPVPLEEFVLKAIYRAEDIQEPGPYGGQPGPELEKFKAVLNELEARGIETEEIGEAHIVDLLSRKDDILADAQNDPRAFPPGREQGYRILREEGIDLEQATAAAKDKWMEELIDKTKSLGDVEIVTNASRQTLPQMNKFMSQDTSPDGTTLEDFLEDDMQAVITRYILNNGGDQGLFYQFGTTTPWEDLYADKVAGEFNEAIAKEADEGKRTKIRKQRDRYMTDAQVMQSILRHLRTAGRNTESIGYRAGRAIRDLNSLTSGGMIGPTSIVDIGLITATYGTMNTHKAAWEQLALGLRNLPARMMRDSPAPLTPGGRASYLASAGTEITLALRLSSIYDIALGEVPERSVERGLHNLAANSGKVFGYTYFTDTMKRLSGNLAWAKLIDDIQTVVSGEGSVRKQKNAAEFLARSNLDPDTIDDVWRQLTEVPGGSEQLEKGGLAPNVEAWDNPVTKRAFLAAIARHVENAPITPGVELPHIVTKDWPYQILFQFKRYSFSAGIKQGLLQSKSVMSRPIHIAVAMMQQIALGLLANWIKALATGGTRWERFQEQDPGQLVYDAFLASGMAGMGNEVLAAASRIPAIRNQITPIKESARASFGRPVGQLFGLTEGVVHKTDKMLSGLHSPGKSTIGYARDILLPYQNHFLLSRAISAGEDFIVDELDLGKKRPTLSQSALSGL